MGTMISSVERRFGQAVVQGALAHGMSRAELAALLEVDPDRLSQNSTLLTEQQCDKLRAVTRLTTSELALAGMTAGKEISPDDEKLLSETADLVRQLDQVARSRVRRVRRAAVSSESSARPIERYLINLVGEYRVCSELCKRGVLATISYGHCKSADVFAISEERRRVLRIEVKTSRVGRFVPSLGQKQHLRDRTNAPDFWILVSLDPAGGEQERFYVLSHDELIEIQDRRNAMYKEKYEQKHQRKWEGTASGVDNVLESDVVAYENRWSAIVNALQTDDRRPSAG